MQHIFGLVAGALLLFIVVKGFAGSYWRKPPSRPDSTAPDWSAYANGDSINSGPPDHGGGA